MQNEVINMEVYEETTFCVLVRDNNSLFLFLEEKRKGRLPNIKATINTGANKTGGRWMGGAEGLDI